MIYKVDVHRYMCNIMEQLGLVKFYFRLGLNYNEILASLAYNHGVILSKRSLHRILRLGGLFRRKYKSDLVDLAVFMEELLQTDGNLHGYRWMHLRCIQRGFVASLEDVRLLLKILDPVGVQLRSGRRMHRREYISRGPNFIWHFDSYDKLKPYGLCINGCIDGFSRTIIWLDVYSTSSDPRVVAGYYMEAVQTRKGCPQKMRGDMGTENGHVAEMQTFLTGNNSFLYGKSCHNQRIESWWGILRRHSAQNWMTMLRRMKDDGHFTGDLLDTSLVQFCFMNLLQVSYSLRSTWS